MLELLNALTVARGDTLYLRYIHDVACLNSDSVGNSLCIRGERINGKWRVQTADPCDTSKMPAIGVLISKSTPTVGKMQIMGPVLNIFTGLTPGKIYHVNLPILTIAPPLPGGLGYSMAQMFGYAAASDILILTGNVLMTKLIS